MYRNFVQGFYGRCKPNQRSDTRRLASNNASGLLIQLGKKPFKVISTMTKC